MKKCSVYENTITKIPVISVSKHVKNQWAKPKNENIRALYHGVKRYYSQLIETSLNKNLKDKSSIYGAFWVFYNP